jgi:hypothetical protein
MNIDSLAGSPQEWLIVIGYLSFLGFIIWAVLGNR